MDNNYKYNEQPKRHIEKYLDPNPTAKRDRITIAMTQKSEKIPPIINVPAGTRVKSNATKNKKPKGIIDILIAREERNQSHENTVPKNGLFHPENFVNYKKRPGNNNHESNP